MLTIALLPSFKESLGLEFPLPIPVIVDVEAVPSVVLVLEIVTVEVEAVLSVVLVLEIVTVNVEAVPSVVLVLEIVTSKYGIMATRSAVKSVASMIQDNFESTTVMVESLRSRSTMYLLSNINNGSQCPFRQLFEESCVKLDVESSRI